MRKVPISINDNEEEKRCKNVFNQKYFKVFRNSSDLQSNYQKFKHYAIRIGSYSSLVYRYRYFDYDYIRDNYAQYLKKIDYDQPECPFCH